MLNQYNFVIDRGNTCTKIALFNKNIIVQKKTFLNSSQNYLSLIFNFIKNINLIRIIFSDVTNFLTKEMFLRNSKHFKIIELNRKTKLPIINKYETHETLGYDRICSAVGATQIYPNTNILIIDVGTAITYDIIDENSKYCGGDISPGLKLRNIALNKYTEKLPIIKIDGKISNFGKNTHEAINNGIVKGILYEMRYRIDSWHNKNKKNRVILTGGDAFFFDKILKKTIFVSSNLNLIGLNRILAYNE